ncbi:MAG: right-handed parallel beta-helix repeat-containing protein [Sedimentisphaerales bacterium]|jgi:nitrous oxidase accessory protein NosD
MNYTTHKNLIMIMLCTLSVFSAQALAVVVPAGSVDALAAAIAEAGPGGEVVLAAGLHKISGTVMVEIPVSIVGEDGAVLESANSAPDDVVKAALHIRGADGARIENLIIQTPADANVAAANAGIVIENASDVQIVDNQITGHTNGVLIEHGDRALLKDNVVQTTKDGIVLINGRDISIQDNWVSCVRFGMWIGSERADVTGNTMQGNMIGLLLCTPKNFVISGEVRVSETPATGCMVYQNYAFDNAWGYLVFDGAFNNLLMNNAAAFNTSYDIELGGESMRFGVLTPTTHDNTVIQGLKYAGSKVKVCGTNNRAQGHINLVDNAEDPCF